MRLRGLLLVAGVALASPAGAQERCGRQSTVASDDIDVRPGDAAENVALDAPVIVRYLGDVDLRELQASLPDDVCQGELVCLFAEQESGEPMSVAGTIQRIDARTIAFVPARPLSPETEYFPLIARAGFETAARSEFEFVTGRRRDREPPELTADADAIQLAVGEVPAQCDAAPGSLRVRLAFAAAHDDGDEGSIEYLLYLSAGSGVVEPRLVARERTPHDTVSMNFVLAADAAQEPLCLVLKAVDGVGRVAERETAICFDPAAGNSFAPLCGVAHAVGGSSGRLPRGPWPTLVLCALMLLILRGCRRGPHG